MSLGRVYRLTAYYLPANDVCSCPPKCGRFSVKFKDQEHCKTLEEVAFESLAVSLARIISQKHGSEWYICDDIINEDQDGGEEGEEGEIVDLDLTVY